jgi:hypothetical protein
VVGKKFHGGTWFDIRGGGGFSFVGVGDSVVDVVIGVDMDVVALSLLGVVAEILNGASRESLEMDKVA